MNNTYDILATASGTEDRERRLSEQGFFITAPLFDDNLLAEIRTEFFAEWDALKKEAAEKGESKRGIVDVETRPFLPRIHRNRPACRAFLSHPLFLELCLELLGGEVDMSWDQGIIKPPQAGDNAFGWHQDAWYAEQGDYLKQADLDLARSNESGITVWVAISRTAVENGTLWVLPGRHNEGLLPHVWSDEHHDWQGEYDTGDAVAAVLEPGQALVFRRYLPHASGQNTSDETRIAYQIGYSVVGMVPDVLPVLRGGRPV